MSRKKKIIILALVIFAAIAVYNIPGERANMMVVDIIDNQHKVEKIEILELDGQDYIIEEEELVAQIIDNFGLNGISSSDSLEDLLQEEYFKINFYLEGEILFSQQIYKVAVEDGNHRSLSKINHGYVASKIKGAPRFSWLRNSFNLGVPHEDANILDYVVE
ncbi:hypothetical protein PRVXH_001586 [Proteinivorax hydrogeniformans]|uniref:Uncharacterized protein n=1 Tax=Proteinivorax hydrogeniformans TaxID=1826727 RepID=A0AAU8HRH8_9FIRM